MKKENYINVSKIASLKTEFGLFKIQTYEDVRTKKFHNLIWHNEINFSKKLTLRIQSSCITSTAFKAKICDCADQTNFALNYIKECDNSALLYIEDEGRGYGMLEKNNVMHYMNNGYNTFTAFEHRGLKPDVRNYNIVFEILKLNFISTNQIDLITNNPNKLNAFIEKDFYVNRIPIEVNLHDDIVEYLRIKKDKLGHLLSIKNEK